MNRARARLGRLEREVEQRHQEWMMTHSSPEFLRRLNDLLGYAGADPDMIWRRDRLRELVRCWRARKAAA